MHPRQARALRDLAALFIVACCALAIAFAFNAVDALVEFLAIAATLGILLTVYSFRRGSELREEISERRRAEEALKESEERYRELFENASEMAYTCDLAGRITSMNKTGERLTGYSWNEARGKTISQIFAPEFEQHIYEIIRQSVREQSSVISELVILAKDGTRVPVEISTRPIYQDGSQVGLQGIARDVNERKQFERQLIHLASQDALTGLFNRRRFEEELQLQLARARRNNTPGALIFLDLDHFKDVNDTLGHWAGDELLTDVASLLKERLPEPSIVARLGGDEFTAILPETGDEEAQTLAEQILGWLRNHSFRVSEQSFAVTASLGVTLIPTDGIATAGELLSRADLAMYQAKEGGRNRVCVYSADIDWKAQIESRLTWRRRIWEALDANRFVLHAQPILDLRRNEVSQYELLLRINEDDGGVIEAETFIHSAERFGLMQAIDRWAVRQAIQLLDEHVRAGREVVFQVNISGRALSDAALLPMIRDELAATPASPRNLVIEITESAAIDNIHQAQQFISDLKGAGCRFALDDFGVGFSSFHQLKHLDVDYLKIDGSFIKDLTHDTADQHLVKAMVDVAHALGKETIAEYVGDEETVQLLRELGVDFAQGYYIGRPCDVSQILSDDVNAPRRAA